MTTTTDDHDDLHLQHCHNGAPPPLPALAVTTMRSTTNSSAVDSYHHPHHLSSQDNHDPPVAAAISSSSVDHVDVHSHPQPPDGCDNTYRAWCYFTSVTPHSASLNTPSTSKPGKGFCVLTLMLTLGPGSICDVCAEEYSPQCIPHSIPAVSPPLRHTMPTQFLILIQDMFHVQAVAMKLQKRHCHASSPSVLSVANTSRVMMSVSIRINSPSCC